MADRIRLPSPLENMVRNNPNLRFNEAGALMELVDQDPVNGVGPSKAWVLSDLNSKDFYTEEDLLQMGRDYETRMPSFENFSLPSLPSLPEANTMRGLQQEQAHDGGFKLEAGDLIPDFMKEALTGDTSGGTPLFPLIGEQVTEGVIDPTVDVAKDLWQDYQSQGASGLALDAAYGVGGLVTDAVGEAAGHVADISSGIVDTAGDFLFGDIYNDALSSAQDFVSGSVLPYWAEKFTGDPYGFVPSPEVEAPSESRGWNRLGEDLVDLGQSVLSGGEKLADVASSVYDDVSPSIVSGAQGIADKGSELLQDIQKKGSDLVSTGVGSGTAPTPPSPNGAPVVPPAPVGPTPEERGATATEAVKKTLMNGDSKQDNAIKQTFDNIVSSLKKAGLAIEDTVGVAAKNWNGLSPSTKAALFGSAVTLYAKSQGWKNTAADAATMTANAWTGLQQQEMQSAEAIKRAQIKAASDAVGKESPIGVEDRKNLRETFRTHLSENKALLGKDDWNFLDNLSETEQESVLSELVDLYVAQYPTRELRNRNPIDAKNFAEFAGKVLAKRYPTRYQKESK